MVSRAHVHRFVLVVLVASAGCNGLPDDGSSAGTTTLTPAPVTSAAEDAGRSGPPGVVDSAVVDPVGLGAAHAAALANVSYTARRTVTRRAPDGSRASRTTVTVRVTAAGDRFLHVVDIRDDDRLVVERYADGHRIYERERSSSGTAYELLRDANGEPLAPASASFGNATNREGIAGIFYRFRFVVTDRLERNGTTFYRLSTTEPETIPPVYNVTGTALVRADGLVRSYELSYRAERGDVPTIVHVRVAFTDVGTTAVPEPAWYDAARNATGGNTAGTNTTGVTPSPTG